MAATAVSGLMPLPFAFLRSGTMRGSGGGDGCGQPPPGLQVVCRQCAHVCVQPCVHAKAMKLKRLVLCKKKGACWKKPHPKKIRSQENQIPRKSETDPKKIMSVLSGDQLHAWHHLGSGFARVSVPTNKNACTHIY
jgi:hypothetical protein